MHRTLERQLRRCGLDTEALPTDTLGWAQFLERVSNSYQEHDQERYLLERSLELSSMEMEALYEKLREESASQIEAERDRLRAIISSLGAGLCVLDDAGKILAVNPEAMRILDWREEDVVGKDLSPWFFLETGVEFATQIASGCDIRNENSHIRDSLENAVPISFVLSPIFEAGRATTAVLVFSDMTEIRAAEEALARARDKAMDLARAKADFLANMSHEIRTPMNGVIGMVDLLLETRLDEQQRDFANTVQSCSHSLLTILNDILDLSKIEAGKMTIEAGPADLKQAIRETTDLLVPSARSKDITLRCEVSEELPAVVTTDGVRFRQILTNLMGNAIKFTERGEVAVSATVTSKSVDSVHVRFEVRDTGIGIARDRLNRVFESFTQADGSMARKFGGTGLGLTISRQLVELLGGALEVESIEGEGSTFYFELELPVAEGVLQARIETPAEVDARPMRILLAEDNATNIKFATYLIKKAGHAVEVAENGKIAVQKLLESSFDLVLMDIQMPGMDGYEATERWRTIEKETDAGRRTPIIAMTANAMDGDEERCLQHGMDGYVSKPIHAKRLREVLSLWAPKSPARSDV